ncbi:MAG: Hpt domain-containing protein, partial [Gemmataceae bacterium]
MTQDFSLIDLFREEVTSQCSILGQGLLDLENTPGDSRAIEPLMRAAYSLKGAARIVGLDDVVHLAHVMEDALVAAQHGKILLSSEDIDHLLRGRDLLAELGEATEAGMREWGSRNKAPLDALKPYFHSLSRGEKPAPLAGSGKTPTPAKAPPPEPTPTPAPASPPQGRPSQLPAAESVVLPTLTIPRDPISPGEENPLYDLFREEVRVSALLLQDGLVDLGKQPATPETLEGLIRATHSLRGAAKIVGLDQPSRLAAAMETTLSTLHQGSTALVPATLPTLHQGTALLVQLIDVQPEEAQGWIERH